MDMCDILRCAPQTQKFLPHRFTITVRLGVGESRQLQDSIGRAHMRHGQYNTGWKRLAVAVGTLQMGGLGPVLGIGFLV